MNEYISREAVLQKFLERGSGYIDEQHYEYEPKFCPEYGAKVKD